MAMNRLQLIPAFAEIFENARNRGMIYGPVVVIRDQILLADISDIAAVTIFREQMVERLVLCRTHFRWDRIIPFFGIGKDRINVKHDAPEIENAVAHDFADTILCRSNGRRICGLEPVKAEEDMTHLL